MLSHPVNNPITIPINATPANRGLKRYVAAIKRREKGASMTVFNVWAS